MAERRNGLIELNLKPNPEYHPTSHETEVFHAMAGKMWVNAKEDRLAEIDGHLIKRVDFWGGLLGHLKREANSTLYNQKCSRAIGKLRPCTSTCAGKALFFKNIGVQENETRSDFQQVPDNLTLAQAAEKLEPRTEAAEQ